MDKYLRANAVFSRFSRSYMELKKELPICPSEMGVLNIITRRGGRYTPLMIAELFGGVQAYDRGAYSGAFEEGLHCEGACAGG